MKRKALVLVLGCLCVIGIWGNPCWAKTIKLQISDKEKVKALWYESRTGEKSPAVLILPGLSGRRDPYLSLAKKLNKSGFNVLAISYYKLERAKGVKFRKKLLYDRGGSINIVKKEVAKSLEFLRSQENVLGERIGLLGASLGTWVGLLAMAEDSKLKSFAMLSPTCGEKGKWYKTYEGMQELVTKFGNRHLLLIGSEKDRSAPESPSAVEKSEYLISIMPNAKIKTKYYPGSKHSYFMLEAHRDLVSVILNWFKETL
jgi:dienelactone hydrolase